MNKFLNFIWMFGLTVMMFFFGSPTVAESNQVNLAKIIEELSFTSNEKLIKSAKGIGWSFYGPMIRKNYLTIEGCLVTAQIANQDAIIEKIEFDLFRSTLPNAEKEGIVILNDNKPGIVIEFSFPSPYKPIYRYDLDAKDASEIPVSTFGFLMGYLEDKKQSHNLLVSLRKYQQDYCLAGS